MDGRIHSEGFKAEVLRKLATSGRPVLEVAAEMGVHERLLYRWPALPSSTALTVGQTRQRCTCTTAPQPARR